MNADPLLNIIALTIRVKGLVQGVGFRPFVYRLAQQNHLTGWVVNGTDGVTIKVEGAAAYMAPFVAGLRYKAPVVAQIEEIIVDQDMPEGLQGFYILASQDLTNETSEISPDIAICDDCLLDLKQQKHRLNYPLINCTNCGPRFTIVHDFPYDRANTTMQHFQMCDQCRSEYDDINDRRFHAQPVACNICGPQYAMYTGDKKITDISDILITASELTHKGEIIAIKGTGGFHLMCDALNENAVNRLRNIKKREGKPFAVMFRDMHTLKEFAEVSEAEERALNSWRRPIVILECIKETAHGISLGMKTIGAFLPYMPFHYLLFEKLNTPCIVLTSGNFSDEPIVIRNDQAIGSFSDIASAIVVYDREIFNRADDSVVRVISDKERLFRRSRGYVPAPVILPFNVDAIFAAGAELSNCFCIGKSNKAYMSQHIGDLKNHETFMFYEESQSRFSQIFRIKPTLVAADMHPDYLSTRFAQNTGLETVYVQHHHAHIASCMAENGVDEPVIGLAFDGTGYGADGNTWGSEFLICDFEKYERVAHFDYMPLPGGDKASEEPWRMGLSLLFMTYGDHMMDIDLPFLKTLDRNIILKVMELLKKQINCPLSSGAGRLFDGIAAITGICVHSLFHSEAPMRLESSIAKGLSGYYAFTADHNISFLPAIKEICNDVISGVDPGTIAARFHNTIIEASSQVAERIAGETGITKVVLSGGSFQNKYLAEVLESKLLKNNLTVYTHNLVPCNDGGIALGQMAVAARAGRRE